jgi:hypothetical protein
MRTSLKVALVSGVLASCIAVAFALSRGPREQPPLGKVLQQLDDHFAGSWGWIEEYEGREWLVFSRGRVRIPYNRESVGLAASADGFMAKRVRELAGEVTFPVVYRISGENEIDRVWSAESGAELWKR